MTFLNVSFGIYAIMPQGWLFMAFIIVIECITMSLILVGNRANRQIYKTVTLSNMISGLIGFGLSLFLNGGWWLVIWLPWVSSNEVSIENGLNGLIIYYIIAFVLTLIIEGLFNQWRLKNGFQKFKIFKATILTNLLTYLIGSLAMYSYSFG